MGVSALPLVTLVLGYGANSRRVCYPFNPILSPPHEAPRQLSASPTPARNKPANVLGRSRASDLDRARVISGMYAPTHVARPAGLERGRAGAVTMLGSAGLQPSKASYALGGLNMTQVVPVPSEGDGGATAFGRGAGFGFAPAFPLGAFALGRALPGEALLLALVPLRTLDPSKSGKEDSVPSGGAAGASTTPETACASELRRRSLRPRMGNKFWSWYSSPPMMMHALGVQVTPPPHFEASSECIWGIS